MDVELQVVREQIPAPGAAAARLPAAPQRGPLHQPPAALRPLLPLLPLRAAWQQLNQPLLPVCVLLTHRGRLSDPPGHPAAPAAAPAALRSRLAGPRPPAAWPPRHPRCGLRQLSPAAALPRADPVGSRPTIEAPCCHHGPGFEQPTVPFCILVSVDQHCSRCSLCRPAAGGCPAALHRQPLAPRLWRPPTAPRCVCHARAASSTCWSHMIVVWPRLLLHAHLMHSMQCNTAPCVTCCPAPLSTSLATRTCRSSGAGALPMRHWQLPLAVLQAPWLVPCRPHQTPCEPPIYA
jgi:hypothetical protein